MTFENSDSAQDNTRETIEADASVGGILALGNLSVPSLNYYKRFVDTICLPKEMVYGHKKVETQLIIG
ncbi:hypothetical protein PHET_02979 [Paragonimus heterotremus]|uniref:Uncharacterized protein n=1 Tax=Paragonimus heterotremus TaxID=100268 RepID=A0A8J4TF60_9TREM|nr:hypothetical protein PHET_02979 [Paragonimus heterotremus]